MTGEAMESVDAMAERARRRRLAKVLERSLLALQQCQDVEQWTEAFLHELRVALEGVA